MSEDKLELVEGNPKDLKGSALVYATLTSIDGAFIGELSQTFTLNETVERLIALGETDFKPKPSGYAVLARDTFEKEIQQKKDRYDVLWAGSYVEREETEKGVLDEAKRYNAVFILQLERKIVHPPSYATLPVEELVPYLERTHFSFYKEALSAFKKTRRKAEKRDAVDAINSAVQRLLIFFEDYPDNKDLSLLEDALRADNKEFFNACVEKIKAMKQEQYERMPALQQRIKTISDRYNIIRSS